MKAFALSKLAQALSLGIVPESKKPTEQELGKRNAVKHALWVALMISEGEIPERVALLISTSHEMDNRDKAGKWGTSDNKIDLHNNFVGADVGRGVVRWKQQHPSGSAQLEAAKWIELLARRSDNCRTCLNMLGGY
jgi:hypothetical protein